MTDPLLFTDNELFLLEQEAVTRIERGDQGPWPDALVQRIIFNLGQKTSDLAARDQLLRQIRLQLNDLNEQNLIPDPDLSTRPEFALQQAVTAFSHAIRQTLRDLQAALPEPELPSAASVIPLFPNREGDPN
jgi:hypothetical protein